MQKKYLQHVQSPASNYEEFHATIQVEKYILPRIVKLYFPLFDILGIIRYFFLASLLNKISRALVADIFVWNSKNDCYCIDKI